MPLLSACASSKEGISVKLKTFPMMAAFKAKKEKRVIQKTDYKRVVFSIALQGSSDEAIGV